MITEAKRDVHFGIRPATTNAIFKAGNGDLREVSTLVELNRWYFRFDR